MQALTSITVARYLILFTKYNIPGQRQRKNDIRKASPTQTSRHHWRLTHSSQLWQLPAAPTLHYSSQQKISFTLQMNEETRGGEWTYEWPACYKCFVSHCQQHNQQQQQLLLAVCLTLLLQCFLTFLPFTLEAVWCSWSAVCAVRVSETRQLLSNDIIFKTDIWHGFHLHHIHRSRKKL